MPARAPRARGKNNVAMPAEVWYNAARMKSVSFRYSGEDMQLLEEISRRNGVSVSCYIVQALLRYVRLRSGKAKRRHRASAKNNKRQREKKANFL